jgi:DNA polymerase III alpha subunit (gram-positive type)
MALFKSEEERRIERDIKIRQGIRRIEKSIAEQNRFLDEFVKNARQARQIGDNGAYQFIRNSVKKTATIKKLLERQLLAVKNALLIKRQAEAVADFSQSMAMMAGEVNKLYNSAKLTQTQLEWEKAMARSQTMEERMNLFLESVESAASADVAAAPAEAISEDEIDRLIEAEDQAEKAREQQQLSGLRAELAALKGPATPGKEAK